MATNVPKILKKKMSATQKMLTTLVLLFFFVAGAATACAAAPCDIVVPAEGQSFMTFAEFQQELDAAQDVNQDGETTVCVRSYSYVRNEVGSYSSDIDINSDNVHIRAETEGRYAYFLNYKTDWGQGVFRVNAKNVKFTDLLLYLRGESATAIYITLDAEVALADGLSFYLYGGGQSYGIKAYYARLGVFKNSRLISWGFNGPPQARLVYLYNSEVGAMKDLQFYCNSYSDRAIYANYATIGLLKNITVSGGESIQLGYSTVNTIQGLTMYGLTKGLSAWQTKISSIDNVTMNIPEYDTGGVFTTYGIKLNGAYDDVAEVGSITNVTANMGPGSVALSFDVVKVGSIENVNANATCLEPTCGSTTAVTISRSEVSLMDNINIATKGTAISIYGQEPHQSSVNFFSDSVLVSDSSNPIYGEELIKTRVNVTEEQY